MTAEQRLTELGLDLPPAPKPAGVYKPRVITGTLAYVSGHGPLLPDGTLMTGQVGSDLDLEGGRRAARQVGLTILATLRSQLGTLDRVERVIKLLGMGYATQECMEHPKVINGRSELFAEVFGEDAGVGTRSAVGMGSLPGKISVEIEGTFEIRD